MNQSQYSPKNLIYYSLALLTISQCSQNIDTDEIFEDALSVDPNVSLDCTGIWEGSPLCQERNEALVALKKLDTLMKELAANDQSPEGLNLYSSINNKRSEGDNKYFNEFYFQARDLYNNASETIISYNEDKNLKLASQIEYIKNLLDSFQLNQAKDTLKNTILANKSNPELRRLDKRISVFNEVSSLNNLARSELDSKNYSQALKIITDAYNLDNARKDTVILMDDIRDRGNEFFFMEYIKNSYSLADRGDIDESYSAFENAKKIFPNRKEISTLRSYINNKSNELNLNSFNKQLSSHILNESWGEAKKVLLSILRINPLDNQASNLLQRVEQFESLTVSIKAILDNPGRLSSKNIRNNLSSLIESSKALSPTGEKNFIKLIERAEEALLEYSSPIILNILSNNSTVVEIVRTTNLEPFNEVNIELYPGVYTIIAKKRGLRSGRLELDIKPGSKNIQIEASCEASCFVNLIDGPKNTMQSSNLTTIKPSEKESIPKNNPVKSIARSASGSFSKYAKLNQSSFNREVDCRRSTNNKAFKINFLISLSKSGKPRTVDIRSIKMELTPFGILPSPGNEEQYVAKVVQEAIKNSTFTISDSEQLPNVFQIEKRINVPERFCVD